jgi:hypothetical protein
MLQANGAQAGQPICLLQAGPCLSDPVIRSRSIRLSVDAYVLNVLPAGRVAVATAASESMVDLGAINSNAGAVGDCKRPTHSPGTLRRQ